MYIYLTKINKIMLKTTILIILSFLLPFILWYLLFSFFTNTFAILNWHWGVKIVFFIIWVGSLEESIKLMENFDRN